MGKKRGRGRPTIYTPELADEICRRMGEGESLRSICRPDDMPVESTVRHWAVENREGFFARYVRAWQTRALSYPDEMEAIADDSGIDVHVDDKGHYTISGEAIQRARLRIDTRKWVASKFYPKLFGDKVSHEVTGEAGGPIEITVTRHVVPATNRIAQHVGNGKSGNGKRANGRAGH